MHLISKLSLNSCIRKIHFIAQIYQETEDFSASYEHTDKTYDGSNFYQGRGFLQLTHKGNYIDFYKSLYSKVPNEEILKEFVPTVATSMEMAMKSAIWYWKEKKINEYADKDDLENVSSLVNAGSINRIAFVRGFDQRTRICISLKKFFDYESCK